MLSKDLALLQKSWRLVTWGLTHFSTHAQKERVCVNFTRVIPVGSSMAWREHFSLALTQASHWDFLVDSVFIYGIDVMFRGLQGPQFGAQVSVLTAVRTSRSCERHKKHCFC